MHHAHTYYKFLIRLCLEDVEQEIRVAILESKDKRTLNNAINRRLYHLAKAHGYRKPSIWNSETNWYKIERQYPEGGLFI